MVLLKKYLRHLKSTLLGPEQARMDHLLVAVAEAHAVRNRARQHLEDLADAEFKGFSQWGEDGMIDWLVECLPGIPETFVEFGVENYLEANTRMLLYLRNWRGLVIDGSEAHIAAIRRQKISWQFDLTAERAFIIWENINGLIEDAGVGEELGLLSVDIDGNVYWVWQAMDVVRLWIVICEYEAVLGDLHALSIPYRTQFNRAEAHYSHLYCGASIRALEHLGREKGYRVVGTNRAGNNVFLVRADKSDLVLGRLGRVGLHGSRFRESRDRSGALSYLRGAERTELLKELPYVDVSNEKKSSCLSLVSSVPPIGTSSIFGDVPRPGYKEDGHRRSVHAASRWIYGEVRWHGRPNFAGAA
jgi:hypothetical protein